MTRRACPSLLSCLSSIALALAIGAGCGSTGGEDPTPTADAARSGNDGEVIGDPPESNTYAVVSTGTYSAVPPHSCVGDFVDHDCDAFIPLTCGAEERVGYEPAETCPLCSTRSPEDPTTCDGWRVAYGDFLYHSISESCANWCAEDSDCMAIELNNACGSYALSLTGWIDEEPIYFGGLFAEHNCGVCGAVEQTVFLRRGGSDVIEGEGQHNGLLTAYQPECRLGQCVLAPAP